MSRYSNIERLIAKFFRKNLKQKMPIVYKGIENIYRYSNYLIFKERRFIQKNIDKTKHKRLTEKEFFSKIFVFFDN